MKNIILIPSVTLLIAFSTSSYLQVNQRTHSHETVVYAQDSNGVVLDSAAVDASGNYRFTHLKSGAYSMIFKKPGYNDIVISRVEHIAQERTYHAALDFEMSEKHLAETKTNTEHKEVIELVGGSPAVTGTTLVSGARRGSRALVAKSSAVTSDVIYKSPAGSGASRGVSTESYAYSAPAKSDGETGAEKVVYRPKTTVDGSMRKSEDLKGDMPGTSVKAGQVTAGFWRDLEHWEKWQETNKDPNVAMHSQTWGFYTDNRFSMRFLDAQGKPVIGKKVELWDSRNIMQWEAMTDNLGNAEFFAHLNDQVVTKDYRTYRVKISAGEKIYEFKIAPYSGSSEIVNLPIKSTVKPIAEVAFVVDATGSMGDEIQYLQAELLDVIARVKKSNKCVDLRMASVFYRDQTDAYVTTTSDFSSNPLDIVNFIYNQSAAGGGDFPEAVDAAMETTMDHLSWSENAITKLMFLVLDAPPHDDSASREKVQRYTRIAAAKGIKIIPVTASGINQSTEFLMKYMAIATNGTYIYITDHSGIGGSHAKPTGVKENVQYLNELIVDIINQNTAWTGCTDSSQNTSTPGTVEIVTNGQWQVQFYPNPAVDHIMIQSSVVPDEIQMFDLAGNVVKTVQQIAGEKTTVDVRELPTGVYIVKCRKGTESVTCRMLVMH